MTETPQIASLRDIIQFAFLVVAALLPISNPLSAAPVFAAYTARSLPAETRRLALVVTRNYILFLLTFLFAGGYILEFFGITLASVQLAGGLVVGYIGFRMLFPTPVAEKRDAAADARATEEDPTLVPLTMPLLAGPGSIAVVLGFASRIEALAPGRQPGAYAITALGIGICALVVYGTLRAAGPVTQRLKPSAIDSVTRILGFLLICIGVSFAGAGFKQFTGT